MTAGDQTDQKMRRMSADLVQARAELSSSEQRVHRLHAQLDEEKAAAAANDERHRTQLLHQKTSMSALRCGVYKATRPCDNA